MVVRVILFIIIIVARGAGVTRVAAIISMKTKCRWKVCIYRSGKGAYKAQESKGRVGLVPFLARVCTSGEYRMDRDGGGECEVW